jgi:Ran GTPase-activating protein (RanGAP) involved in mRNA processing and transport
VEDALLDALGARVAMSRAALLAADKICWTHKGIGLDGHAHGLAVLLKRSTKLVRLVIDDDSLRDEDLRVLAAGLEGNATLRELVVCHARMIGHVGAAALARMLPSATGLVELSLFESQIGELGAAALAQALHSMPQLERLRLKRNKIGDVGAAALARALPSMRQLNKLDLGGNSFGHVGLSQLTAAMPSSLEKILL